jgi:hypothetical protein
VARRIGRRRLNVALLPRFLPHYEKPATERRNLVSSAAF